LKWATWPVLLPTVAAGLVCAIAWSSKQASTEQLARQLLMAQQRRAELARIADYTRELEREAKRRQEIRRFADLVARDRFCDARILDAILRAPESELRGLQLADDRSVTIGVSASAAGLRYTLDSLQRAGVEGLTTVTSPQGLVEIRGLGRWPCTAPR